MQLLQFLASLVYTQQERKYHLRDPSEAAAVVHYDASTETPSDGIGLMEMGRQRGVRDDV